MNIDLVEALAAVSALALWPMIYMRRDGGDDKGRR